MGHRHNTRLSKWFKHSLRNQLITVFCSIIIIPMVISIYISNKNFSNEIEKNYIISNHLLLEQCNSRLDSYLKELDQLSLSLYSNLIFTDKYQQSDEWIKHSSLMETLMSIYIQRDEIHSVVYYIPEKQETVVINDRLNESFQYIDGDQQPARIHNFLESRESFKLEPSYLLEDYPQRFHMSNERVFTILRKIMYDKKIEGILAINYNLNFMEEIASELITDDTEQIMYIAKTKEKLYATNNSINLNDGIINTIKEGEDKNNTFHYNDSVSGKEMLVVYSVSDNSDNIICKFIPLDVILDKVARTRNINLFIVISMIIIVILATILVSYKITKPLSILENSMERVGEGDFNCISSIEASDEIGNISRGFDNMVLKIRMLIKEKYEMTLSYRTVQLKALQAQINPHFLYNTLQGIGSVAIEAGVDEVEEMTRALSQMLRYSVKSGGDTVTLTEELKNIRDYLSIQKFRYEERLNYVIEGEEDLNFIKLPKITLQPIVENSVLHGMERKKTPMLIQINYYRTNKGVCITIKDNGLGMTKGTLKEVQNSIENLKEVEGLNEERLGISNVYRRLKFLYEEKFVMCIESQKDVGTNIELFISE